MFGHLESQKQVNFGDGVKNRIIEAAVIINPPHPPKKIVRKTKREKNTKREKREDSNPLIWSPTAAVNRKLLRHPLAQSATPQKRTKKSGGGEVKNSEERARTCSSVVLLL